MTFNRLAHNKKAKTKQIKQNITLYSIYTEEKKSKIFFTCYYKTAYTFSKIRTPKYADTNIVSLIGQNLPKRKYIQLV